MFQKTQAELLKSPLVLGKALSHPKVAKLPSVLRRPDPIEWLADELTLTFVGELLYIELRERRSAGGGQAGQRRDRRLPGRGRQRRQQSAQGTPRPTQGNPGRT